MQGATRIVVHRLLNRPAAAAAVRCTCLIIHHHKSYHDHDHVFFSALEAGVRHHIQASVKPPSDVALAGSMACVCAEDTVLPSASGYIGQLAHAFQWKAEKHEEHWAFDVPHPSCGAPLGMRLTRWSPHFPRGLVSLMVV